MAATLTDEKEVFISFPIAYKEATPDGDLLVYGKVTDGTIDSDEQIVDSDWSAKALQDWLTTGGNVRVQHNAHRDPAGVGLKVDINRDGDGAHWLQAEVCEPVAKTLVRKGALRAFSVGIMRPKIVTHSKARGGAIVGGEMGEVSLVDRPANKNCAFSLVKAAKEGNAERVGKMEGDEGMIQKALTPTPADLARVLQPQKGRIPDRIVSNFYADPVASRLNEALFDEAILAKAASDQALSDAEIEKNAMAEDLVLEGILGKKHREFSASERKLHAREGNALPDGSYPIPDKDALRRAAILARSGHGNVQGARALIARRAREMGVSNPLSSKDKVKNKELMDELTDILVKAVQDGLVTIDEATELAATDKAAEPDLTKCGTCNGLGTIRGGSVACPDCSGKSEGEPDTEKASKKPTDDSGNDDDGGDTTGTGDGDNDEDDAKKSAGDRPRNVAHGSVAGAGKGPGGVVDGDSDDDNASGPGGRNYQGNKGMGTDGMMTPKPKPAGPRGKNGKKKVPGNFMKCSECGEKANKNASFCAGCGCKFVSKSGNPAAGVQGTPSPAAGPNTGSVQETKTPPTWENEVGPGDKGPASRGSAIMSDSGGGTQAIGAGDAGDSTGIPGAKPVKKPDGHARKGQPAPYALARAHDAFCAAFPAEAVLSEYPSLAKVSDAVSVDDLQEAAGKAFGEKDFELAESLLGIARNAEDIAKADSDVLEDARSAMFKGFQSMYPDAHPTPGCITPGMFQRPYISSGHAPGSAEPMKPQPPATIPPEAQPASSFTRGPITAGHEAASPGDTYGPRMKAEHAMNAIHDHIAGVFPDLCPMSYETPVTSGNLKGQGVPGINLQAGDMTPDDLAKAVQDALAQAAEPAAVREATLVKAEKAKAKADHQLSEDMSAMKSLIMDLTKSVTTAAEAQSTTIDQLKSQVAEQQKLIDLLGSQPDPNLAPNRGMITTGNPGGAQVVERRSLIDDAAAKAREEKLQFLASIAQSGDPTMRVMVEDQIQKMLA